MKKIPTIFIRDLSRQPALLMPVWKPGCEWVRDGEGVATLKHDGTCCLVRGGRLYKRRELKAGQPPPPEFELADFDDQTGKTMGRMPVLAGNPEDQFHLEALGNGAVADGTYELMGPKIQGNKSGFTSHRLVRHAMDVLEGVPRTFDGLRTWLGIAAPGRRGLASHGRPGRQDQASRLRPAMVRLSKFNGRGLP
jgi:hypothetical protein